MKLRQALWLLGTAALVGWVASCGEALQDEAGSARAPRTEALSPGSFRVTGSANLYQRTDPSTVVPESMDPIRVPDARLCAGQQIQLTASGCVVTHGPICTKPDGHAKLFRDLPLYSLIGQWSTSPTELTPATAVGAPFFVGSAATLTAPAALREYYLFLGENDRDLSDNEGAYSVSASWTQRTTCVLDGDNDKVPDHTDNCPAKYNPTQLDSDGNYVGDVCEPMGPLELNTDRPGFVYRTIEQRGFTPEMCQATCHNEQWCMAFTFAPPGGQWTYPRCMLKDILPVAVPNNCCISGMKQGQRNPIPREPPPPPPPTPPNPLGLLVGVRLTANDYRSFDLPEPKPELCHQACYAEAACKAFTYVKPGVQGPTARCLLKHVIGNPTPDECCTSSWKSDIPDVHNP